MTRMAKIEGDREERDKDMEMSEKGEGGAEGGGRRRGNKLGGGPKRETGREAERIGFFEFL